MPGLRIVLSKLVIFSAERTNTTDADVGIELTSLTEDTPKTTVPASTGPFDREACRNLTDMESEAWVRTTLEHLQLILTRIEALEQVVRSLSATPGQQATEDVPRGTVAVPPVTPEVRLILGKSTSYILIS